MPEPTPETRRTVEYIAQARKPDGSWEMSSSPTTNREYALERLAQRRQRMPQLEHRFAQRTTTVVVEPIDEAATPAPDPANVREQIAETLWPLTDWDGDYLNAEAAADAVLRVPAIAEALAAVERIRDVAAAWERHPSGRHVYIHEAARVIREALNPQDPS